MADYEPHKGDRVRCVAADGSVKIDEVGSVLLVIREPSIVLSTDSGKTYVVALPTANLERLGA